MHSIIERTNWTIACAAKQSCAAVQCKFPILIAALGLIAWCTIYIHITACVCICIPDVQLTCNWGQRAALFHQRTVDEPGAMAQGIGLLCRVPRQAIAYYDQHINNGTDGQQRDKDKYPDPKIKGRQQTGATCRFPGATHDHYPLSLVQCGCRVVDKTALLRQWRYKSCCQIHLLSMKTRLQEFRLKLE